MTLDTTLAAPWQSGEVPLDNPKPGRFVRRGNTFFWTYFPLPGDKDCTDMSDEVFELEVRDALDARRGKV